MGPAHDPCAGPLAAEGTSMRCTRRLSSYLIVLGLVIAAAAVAVMAGCTRGRVTHPVSSSARSAPLAVVLDARRGASSLVVVDLVGGRVVRRIRLRSFVTDIALDASRGIVAAAQSGGIAEKADDAISLTDPRTGAVRYTTLAYRDPVSVVCIGGKAFVLHALVDTRGLGLSVVDVASARLAGSGHAPDGPGLWTSACGGVWTTVMRSTGEWPLVRIDPATLVASATAVAGFRAYGAVETTGSVLMLGTAADSTCGALIVRLTSSGRIESSGTVPGMPRPATMAAVAGSRLVVGDWNGEPAEDGVLAVIDAATLRRERSLTGLGVPCALASWRDRVLAVDRIAGRLIVADPATGRVDAKIDLGVRNMVFSDVVVLDPE